MSSLETSVGQRLTAARLRRGLSQATVSRRAGIASSYVSRIENGRVQPTFRTVLRVVEALRAELSEIFDPDASHRSRQRGPCPITAGGQCLLDLIRPEGDSLATDRERFTPRQLRLLRRLADWLKQAGPDRLRAMEILLEDLSVRRDAGDRTPGSA